MPISLVILKLLHVSCHLSTAALSSNIRSRSSITLLSLFIFVIYRLICRQLQYRSPGRRGSTWLREPRLRSPILQITYCSCRYCMLGLQRRARVPPRRSLALQLQRYFHPLKRSLRLWLIFHNCKEVHTKHAPYLHTLPIRLDNRPFLVDGNNIWLFAQRII